MHLEINDDGFTRAAASGFGMMILDQVGRSDSQDYNSGFPHHHQQHAITDKTDVEMTGTCGELKRRGHHLDTVPEVPSSGQVLPAAPHNHSRPVVTNNNKTGARPRAGMKLELSSSNSVTRPGRAFKQRPLALFKARMAQVQQSRSPNRSPCKSPAGSNGQYLMHMYKFNDVKCLLI